MEKFCDFITNPDWWAVGLTAINTIAVVIIAWVQIRMQRQQTILQQRQTEAQEYEIYRKLYPLVYSANNSINSFMSDMWSALWEPTYRFEGENFLDVRIKEIDRLINELSQNRIDFELKFSKEFFDLNGYIDLLSRMSIISHHIANAINNEDVVLTKGVHTAEGNYVGDIVRHFKKQEMKILLTQRLEKFIEVKNGTRCNDEILNVIKKRCKID